MCVCPSVSTSLKLCGEIELFITMYTINNLMTSYTY